MTLDPFNYQKTSCKVSLIALNSFTKILYVDLP